MSFFALVDCNSFVRREKSINQLFQPAAAPGWNRLSHQPYPTRKCGRETARVKHSDNVSLSGLATSNRCVPATPIRGCEASGWLCQHHTAEGGKDRTAWPTRK